jgi:PHD/YefM family antitoxin component YafN of YafNO toxin-antitoxin module
MIASVPMMDLATDIHSLTDFKRRTAVFIEQIKQTGHPLVLTLNGKAELVVQDAASYQKLLDMLDRAEAIEGIRKGLKSVEEGRTRPVEEVFEEIRREHEVPR